MSFPFLFHIDEQQADGSPDKLTDADYQGDEYARPGRQGKTGRRHKETALAPAKLQRKEKQEVGEQTGESEYQDALGKGGVDVEDKQDEHYLKRRTKTASQFKRNGRDERLAVLVVQGGNLAVDGVKLLFVFLYETTRPAFQTRNMAHEAHQPDGHAFSVAFYKEPHAENAKRTSRRKDYVDNEIAKRFG